MHGLAVNRDGPALTRRFDLQEFPQSVPAAWKDQGYNRLQLALSMTGLQSLVLSGWATQVNGALHIAPNKDGGVRVQFESSSVSFGAEAPHAVLVRVSPYMIEQ